MSGRGDVLRLYKHLHRTVGLVFQGDSRAIAISKARIRDEYAKNRGVTSANAIRELVKVGHEAGQVLKTQVIQAVQERGEVDPKDGRPIYRAVLRDDQLVTNAPFKDNVSDEEYKASVRAHRKRQKEEQLKNKKNKSAPSSCDSVTSSDCK